MATEGKSLYATREAALAAPGDVYVHYKGGVYRVLYRDVRHSEDEGVKGVLVVYEHLYPHEHKIWARPQDMFFGKNDEGQQRFTPVTRKESSKLHPSTGMSGTDGCTEHVQSGCTGVDGTYECLTVSKGIAEESGRDGVVLTPL